MNSHSAKRQRLIWVLATVFLLLIGAIMWLESDRTPSTTQSLSNINNITIKRAGHDDIKLIRSSAKQWQMSRPYTLNASNQRIDPLLTLGTAKLDGYETSDVDMVATGLNNPGASFTIGERTFLLGLPDISGERRYALVDEKVTLLPEWVWSLVHGGVTAFADLNVFESLPDTLYLMSESDTSSLASIEQWRALQADKITPWPLDAITSSTEDPDRPVEMARWIISTSQDNAAGSQLAELVQFTERTIIQTKPGFAYAISNARLNELLSD